MSVSIYIPIYLSIYVYSYPNWRISCVYLNSVEPFNSISLNGFSVNKITIVNGIEYNTVNNFLRLYQKRL